MPFVIAMDGPAGSGKSSVGAVLGERLGFFYFDTGILYRAVALAALRAGVDLSDEAALGQTARGLDVQVLPPPKDSELQALVILAGLDVSREIRSSQVDAVVSRVAASRAVRQGLIDVQRAQIRAPGTVMVGRDIGTVICPDANLKIYLDASAEERAHRRVAQSGADTSRFQTVLANIKERDRVDSSRDVAPLALAADAVSIDTDDLTIPQVVDRIVMLVEERRVNREGSPSRNR
ncbi:MAG: (d)CMP kinase [Chloroflexota bacterium]